MRSLRRVPPSMPAHRALTPLPPALLQLKDEHGPEACKLALTVLHVVGHETVPHLLAAALASGAMAALLDVPARAPVAQQKQVLWGSVARRADAPGWAGSVRAVRSTMSEHLGHAVSGKSFRIILRTLHMQTAEALIHFMVALERMQAQAASLAAELQEMAGGGGTTACTDDTTTLQQLRGHAEQMKRGIAAVSMVRAAGALPVERCLWGA